MPSSMAQQEQSGGGGGGGPGSGGGGGGVRRRSLESPMKESQARTKVVLRHLPPSISEAGLLEHIDSKFAGCYTWFSFRPGKVSVKKQVPARAYVNFKKPEDVYDFSEHLDGHIFVNEKGTQHKVAVEYAPYQRIPKPRSKKDIREGTITKDPDYLEFLEMLGKPLEYLPSAEVQLERREAEKAAALGAGGCKETVVTPLMEFVRQRRAAKSAPQRSLSSKLVSRPGGLSVATSNAASHKRAVERSRAGAQMDFKEVQARDHTGGQRREEHRKEREVVIERRRKEMTEAKERKLFHGDVTSAGVSGMKGNATTFQLVDSSKENAHVGVLSKHSLAGGTDGELAANEGLAVDVDPLRSRSPAASGKFANEVLVGDATKDLKREVLRRKQLSVTKEKLHKDSEGGPTSPGQMSASGSYNQRHRPPVSPRVTSAATLSQLVTAGERSTAAAPSKLSQRVSARNSSRGSLSPRDQQSPSHASLHLDSSSQQPMPAERGGKRPPRPHNIRMSGKEQASSLASSAESEQGASQFSNFNPAEEKLDSFPASERQDSRRVRNKDRPDRPVWTPRRRSDVAQTTDPSSFVSSAAPGLSEEKSETSKLEKSERGLHKQVGKAVSISAQNSGMDSKGAEGAAGQHHPDGGGRSQSGTASQVGNIRPVESGSIRSARNGRSTVSCSNAAANQEHAGVSNQGGEYRSDSSLSVDPKAPPSSLYNARENGESHISSSVVDKEKRKQDTPQWNELTGGGHRSGDRRRERSGQHNSRDSDGNVVTAELSKPVKRGGTLALGGNESEYDSANQTVSLPLLVSLDLFHASLVDAKLRPALLCLGVDVELPKATGWQPSAPMMTIRTFRRTLPSMERMQRMP